MKPLPNQPSTKNLETGKSLMAPSTVKDVKERYKKHYTELKSKGLPFFPFTVYKDAVVALIIMLILLALAIFAKVPLEEQANPLDSSYVPRPEWYFLFFFELLKHFPGKLEFLGAMGVPIGILLVLLLLPFFDRNPLRQPRRRPLAVTAMVVFLVALVSLSVVGARSPTPTVAGISAQPPVTLTPLELEGRRVYESQSCAICHQINGEGGGIGPDLSTVGKRLSASWLVGHLQEPKLLVPGTRMPDYAFSNEDLMALTAYLLSLKEAKPPPAGTVIDGQLSPSAEAGKTVFQAQCSACHPKGNAGIGPKLAGAKFDQKFKIDDSLKQLIRQGAGSMPAYKPEQISDQQLSDLIAYMKALKETP